MSTESNTSHLYHTPTDLSKGDKSTYFRCYLPECLPTGLDAKALHLIHTLYLKRYTDKEHDRDDFYPLHSRLLQTVYGKQFSIAGKGTRDSLVVAKVLEWESSYQADKRSMGYRLTDQYRNQHFAVCNVPGKLLKKKLDERRTEEQNRISSCPIERNLNHWLNQIGLVDSWPTPSLSLTMLANQDLFQHRPNQGRIFTNLTNLDKEYRKFIRLNGKPLFAVDIKNCQPLLFGLSLLNTKMSTNHQHQPPQSSTNTFMLGDCSVQKFINDCKDGVLYESIMGELGTTDRNWVKKSFIRVLYDQPRDNPGKVGLAFKNLYPTPYESAMRIYREFGKGELARRMQKLEAELMIDSAAKTFIEQDSARPILTLHDSLLTTQECHQFAQDSILEAFSTRFGATPVLDVKEFTA